MRKSKKLRTVLTVGAAAVLLCAVGAVLFVKQVIHLNKPSETDYPVRGVDVSNYQGEIDWTTLSQGLDFAYIKATEGSSFVDSHFAFNYAEAQRTPLRVGAYHFFSFDSSGKTQAENYIASVEPYERMLPPVVDVEFYGEYSDEHKPSEEVVPEIADLLGALEDRYGVKPVIYATGSAYKSYIKGNFDGYDVWIRDVYFKPERDWMFWQWSSVGRLDGYDGEEECIDLNVFNGSKAEFKRYGLCNIAENCADS